MLHSGFRSRIVGINLLLLERALEYQTAIRQQWQQRQLKPAYLPRAEDTTKLHEPAGRIRRYWSLARWLIPFNPIGTRRTVLFIRCLWGPITPVSWLWPLLCLCKVYLKIHSRSMHTTGSCSCTDIQDAKVRDRHSYGEMMNMITHL